MTLLVFLLLKLAELAALLFLPIAIGKLTNRFLLKDSSLLNPYRWWHFWLTGAGTILVLFIGVIAVVGLLIDVVPALLDANWELAKALTGP